MSDEVSKKRICVVLKRNFLKALDQLVEKDFYMDYQDAMRDGLRLLFRYRKIEPFYTELDEEAELEDATLSEQ